MGYHNDKTRFGITANGEKRFIFAESPDENDQQDEERYYQYMLGYHVHFEYGRILHDLLITC